MVVIRRELPSDSVTRVCSEIDLPQWHIDEDSPFRVPFGRFMLLPCPSNAYSLRAN